MKGIILNPGDRFGRLTVESYAGANKHRTAMWKCKCDCGKETTVRGTDLRSGKTKSCGCLQRDVAKESITAYDHSERYKCPDNTTHGMRHTRLYNIWRNMKQRCNNPNHERFKYYGAKGVTVCEEWQKDFGAFSEWALSNGYKENLSIDRIDGSGNYEPGNCRWATKIEQIANRSTTVTLEHDGETKPLAEWCRLFGTNYKAAHRNYKAGKRFDEIFPLAT